MLKQCKLEDPMEKVPLTSSHILWRSVGSWRRRATFNHRKRGHSPPSFWTAPVLTLMVGFKIKEFHVVVGDGDNAHSLLRWQGERDGHADGAWLSCCKSPGPVLLRPGVHPTMQLILDHSSKLHLGFAGVKLISRDIAMQYRTRNSWFRGLKMFIYHLIMEHSIA